MAQLEIDAMDAGHVREHLDSVVMETIQKMLPARTRFALVIHGEDKWYSLFTDKFELKTVHLAVRGFVEQHPDAVVPK